jgi:hypothetical protein
MIIKQNIIYGGYTMKKNVLFLLIIGFVLLLGACNNPAENSPVIIPGGAEEVSWDVDHLFSLANASDYPGAEVDLAGRGLLDISNYASVTVNATLYTDEAGSVKATMPAGDNKNLAQFSLLKATGGWGDENKCGPTKYNMAIDGDTIWTVPGSASGVPLKMLLQANWADFTADGVKVKTIKVNRITFSPKTSDVVLDLVYDNGSYLTVAGNKIIFNNATYSDAAALFVFPSTFPATLTGKTLVITFTIPNHSDVPSTSGAIDVEHQIHIQAANSDKQRFNGRNPSSANGNVGQKYITLDSAGETGWDETGGTIRVSLNDLLAAAAVSASDNDCKGPFTLDAIRIVNNGTTWSDAGVNHVRCKSYTLVIESVTVQ